MHYFGGVPQAIVPDNRRAAPLKAAVTQANRYEPLLNETFGDFALHYQTTILPTRSSKPRDKALVEGAVNILYRRTQMAIRAARFRYQASLEELHYEPSRNLDKTIVMRLADCRFIDRAENIFLTGSTGCGKSYVASAFGYQACQLGYRVGYYNLMKLMQRLQLAKADGSYQREMSRLERQHLLILDDWGLQPLDQNARLTLLQIMAAAARRIGMVKQLPSSLPSYRWASGMSILGIRR